MPEIILEARRLSRYYSTSRGPIRVLHDINLRIYQGDFVVVLGPSGSGKSTLLNLLGGIDADVRGVAFRDRPVWQMSENELARMRRHHMGFVFQSFNLVTTLTAAENISLPLLRQRVPLKEVKQRVRDMLDAVGLGNRAHHLPSKLSGGEQQRVAVGRALIHNPDLVLADEPTGNLDSKTGRQIMQLLKHFNQTQGQTLVCVTHDPGFATIGNRAIYLSDGRVERSEVNQQC